MFRITVFCLLALAVCISGLSFATELERVTSDLSHECEGVFRTGYECSKAVDGDWMTSAIPDAYNDSVAVIEDHTIPSCAVAARWHFKVLRNNPDIEVKAYYWDYDLSEWVLFYDVPVNYLDYTTYTKEIPANALLSSPLRTKMHVKNAGAMSGEYFEGAVDWIFEPSYEGEGWFRSERECSKAVDGDWMTWSCPEEYGDSVLVTEYHSIPDGVDAAKWNFKVLRNYDDIIITAYYWNYGTSEWTLLYEVPKDLDPTTYVVEIPSNGIVLSPLITRMYVKNASSPLVSGYYYEGVVDWIHQSSYECEGVFRTGYECSKAVDGDWMTSAIPDAYNDSVAVIEDHAIPSCAVAARWHFKVLRNNPDIEVKAYYWDYDLSEWVLFYDVPVNYLDYTTYTEEIPSNALMSSPLRTKMHVKNAGAMSGEYFEGAVDWIFEPSYECEGWFRAGYKCSNAVDGDWDTSAIPDAYGDSATVTEYHAIPTEADAARWHFKVLRNWENIEITALYWDYVTSEWTEFYYVPVTPFPPTTHTVPIPASGLLSSPLKTKMYVKNASSPQVSGEYFEGVVDWIGENFDDADTLFVGRSENPTPYRMSIPIYLNNHQPIKSARVILSYDWPFDPDKVIFGCTRSGYMDQKLFSIDHVEKIIDIWVTANLGSGALPLAPIDESCADSAIAYIQFDMPVDCGTEWMMWADTATICAEADCFSTCLVDTSDALFTPAVIFDSTFVAHYRSGDANGTGNVDIDDVVSLIGYIFSGGTPPVCDILAGDADGSCGTDIDDVIYLINYIFGGGPIPVPDCIECSDGPMFAKRIVGSAEIAVVSDDGIDSYTLSADREVQAVQLEFVENSNVDDIRVESLVDGIEVFYGHVDGVFRVGLVDLYGAHMIPSGETDIIRISCDGDGKLDLTNSIIVAKGGGHLDASVSRQTVDAIKPSDFALYQNRPNPFNPTTEISFNLPVMTNVRLDVYNIMGQKVTTLVDGPMQPGPHSVTWNGMSDGGEPVASGIYFYRIEAGDFTENKKMLLLK